MGYAVIERGRGGGNNYGIKIGITPFTILLIFSMASFSNFYNFIKGLFLASGDEVEDASKTNIKGSRTDYLLFLMDRY